MNAQAKFIALIPSLMIAGTAAAAPYRGSYDYAAADSPYIGVNAGVLRYDEQGLNSMTPDVILGRIGFPVASNISIEGRLGTGLSSDHSFGLSTSVQSFGGAYVKGALPLSPLFSVYGTLGLATVHLDHNYGDGGTSDTGLSFGVGGDVALPRNVWLNFEWTRLPGGTNAGYDYTSDLFTAGVFWHLY